MSATRSNIYDSDTYTERRAQMADDALCRLDAQAAQNARRFVAIERTKERMRRAINTEPICTLSAAIFHGLINELGRANEVRAGDDAPVAPLSRITPEMLGRPITLELVEDDGHVLYSI
jgi:hypothetical protein